MVIPRSKNSKLKDKGLSAEAFSLRMRAVSKAIEVITEMDEDSFQEVQKFTEVATREELIHEITRYMQSGTYSGQMGDLLPYIGASFLGQPLLTIVLTKDGPYCTYADPSFDKFGGCEEVQCPCVVVQSGSHYEDLLLQGESKDDARQLYEKLKRGSTTAFNPGTEHFHFEPMFTSTPCDLNSDINSQPAKHLSQTAEPMSQPAEPSSQREEPVSGPAEPLSQQAETLSQQAKILSQQAETPSRQAETSRRLAETLSRQAQALRGQAETQSQLNRYVFFFQIKNCLLNLNMFQEQRLG